MDIFPMKTYNDQQLHAKMPNMTSPQRNANLNHNNHDLSQF